MNHLNLMFRSPYGQRDRCERHRAAQGVESRSHRLHLPRHRKIWIFLIFCSLYLFVVSFEYLTTTTTKTTILQTHEIAESQSKHILAAIVNGMRKEEKSDHVKLAACNALINSLEFSRSNFSKDVSAAAASPVPVLFICSYLFC